MGGITRALFGGSKETSSSDNQAYGTLLGLLKGNVGQGNTAMGTLSGLLGLGGKEGSDAAMKNYLDSSNYKFLLDSGSKAITGNMASKGLLNSGATGKALTRFGQDLGQTKIDQYMTGLKDLGSYGLQSAGVIGGAGSQSTSSGSSSDGIFNSLFPNGLSDRRAKIIHDKLGELSNGIGVYVFSYKARPDLHMVGVIAQEVQEIQPDALGPTLNGMLTVDYDKLEQRNDLPPYGCLVTEAA